MWAGKAGGSVNQEHQMQPGEAQVCLGYWRARVAPKCPQLSPCGDGEVPGTITQGVGGSSSDDRPHRMCHSCRLRVEEGV